MHQIIISSYTVLYQYLMNPETVRIDFDNTGYLNLNILTRSDSHGHTIVSVLLDDFELACEWGQGNGEGKI